jgi:DNA-binding response OmpR family regulator
MEGLVLIIDDDEMVRSALFALLEIKDFNILAAEDGLFGLRLAREFQPDLIICDIDMPKLNGFQVLNELRADLNIARIPFIFHTSLADLDSQYRARQLGANDYLIKPVDINKLLESIVHQCQLSVLEKEGD